MYIDDWFGSNFFKKLPLGFHQNFTLGQFFRTHAYYPHENLELWRPIFNPGETTRTLASQFQIVAAPNDAFRRSLPLATPKLETNEEFLVVRAKVRPVVLVMPEPAPFGVSNTGYAGRVQRHRCIVGQVFGLADPKTQRQAFSSSFVERVRKMEFPQLIFLPASPGLLEVDRILRLDELQSVFTPHLDATQWVLGDEVIEILRGQLHYLLAGVGPSKYTELRELLLRNGL